MAVGAVTVCGNGSAPRSATTSVMDMDMDVSEANGGFP